MKRPKSVIAALFSSGFSWTRWLLAFILAAYLFANHLGYITQLREQIGLTDFSIKFAGYEFTAFKLLNGIVSLIAVIWIASLIAAIGEKRILSLGHIRPSNRTLLVNGFKLIIFIFVFFTGMNVLGINPTALTVFGGALGIGIGFGLQKIASNFISGLILLLEKSVEQGDLIELDGGIYGYVRKTGARYTLVETLDNKEVMIPNEDFITHRVTNLTFTNPKGRMEIVIGVSYDSDIERAREILLEIACAHPAISKDPAPQCYLKDYGASSVDFLLYAWVDDVTAGRLEPRSDILRNIWKAFKAENIGIPYPQTDVHIKSGPPA